MLVGNRLESGTHGLGKHGQGFVVLLQFLQILILMFVTSLARIGDYRVLQGILGQQSDKNMAMQISRFGAPGNPGHVAPNAVRKRVDRMREIVIEIGVTKETLLRAGCLGLGTRAGYSQLVHVMAGSASDTFHVMFGLQPINILLVVTLGKFIGIKIPDVPCGKRGGFKKRLQSFSRLVTDRPLHIFRFC